MTNNSRKTMSIIAYFLSEHDLEASKSLGFKNRNDAFIGLSEHFKLEDHYLKLRRDEFDALPNSSSVRKGFSSREANAYTIRVASDLERFSFKELLTMTEKICSDSSILYEDLLDASLNLASITSIFFPEADVEHYTEGAKVTIQVNKYERNPVARKKCISIKGCYCHICKFDFEKAYGEIGKDFIHVHHIKPLHKSDKEYIVDPINDLLPVCPNCHAMLHRKINGENISIENLKNML